MTASLSNSRIFISNHRPFLPLLCLWLSTSALLAQGIPPAAPATGTFSSPAPIERLQGLGTVFYREVQSQLLEHEYHVFVRLPEQYQEKGDTRFPTLYLLDGGVTFPLIASYYQYLSFSEEVPEMIIVGISYGASDFASGNLRGHDYTAPAKDREHYGGAADFRKFFEKELFPLVEAEFRSDGNRRLIFGQSLGGQFVLDTALRQPTLFWGYIASNPALHRNLELFLEPAAATTEAASTKTESPRLFVSSGEHDDPRFREPAMKWINHWQGQSDLPWDLETRTLEGQTHMSAAPASFRQGVAWLFERAE